MPSIGDEAWWWEETDLPGGGAVLRVEGRAALISLGGQFNDRLAYAAADRLPPGPDAPDEGADDEVDPVPALSAQQITTMVNVRLSELAAAAADRLLPAPFEARAGGGGEVEEDPAAQAMEVCAAVSADQLAIDLEEPPEGASLMPIGERGCTFAAASGVNITVEVLGTDASEEALQVGRESTVDGETITWVPEPVDGLGGTAVWLADPVSGTAGDLFVLQGSTLVRVSSSGPSPEGLRERAITAFELVGADLVALAAE